MSKINNGGLDQYDKDSSLNGIGSERVNIYVIQLGIRIYIVNVILLTRAHQKMRYPNGT